ncbi:hypothetical protein PTKIN_Ptkin19aG0027800 [Pterospermum kingtungense]
MGRRWLAARQRDFSELRHCLWMPRLEGLQDKIKLVPLKLQNRPAWYKEKIYAENKADIAYISFVERFQIFLLEVFMYDITAGRPKLAAWIEELNKIDAYKKMKKTDPKELVEYFKQRYLAQK